MHGAPERIPLELNRHCDRERSEREAIQHHKSDLWIASSPLRGSSQ
jgi:hypothetical protein